MTKGRAPLQTNNGRIDSMTASGQPTQKSTHHREDHVDILTSSSRPRK